MAAELSPEDALAARFEELQDPMRFDALLALATETCLRDPNTFTAKLAERAAQEAPTEETRVLQTMGLWGLREAVEIEHTPMGAQLGSMLKNRDSRILDSTDIMGSPDNFSGARDPEITRKIAAFGSALIEEAFACLGKSAEEMVERYRTGDNEAKVTVLNWLTKRIDNIQELGDTPFSQMSNKEYFYHPIRLSPKAIGEFPEINVSASCLGMTILATAFLAKAGVRTLHAGVARSSDQQARIAAADAGGEAIYLASTAGITLPDTVHFKLMQMALHNMRSVVHDNGYHAAVYAHLEDDEWLEIDLNYHKLGNTVPSNSHLPFHELWDTLAEYAAHEPGLEIMYSDDFSLESISDFLRNSVEARLGSMPDVDAWEAWLQEAPDSLHLEDVARAAIDPAFFRPLHEDETEAGRRALIWEGINCRQRLQSDEEPSFGDKFFSREAQDVLAQYVFSTTQGDLAAELARSKVDAAHRRTLAEGLRAAPILMYSRLMGKIAEASLNNEYIWAHRSVEVGLPEYRIGAAVLSDFGVYCDNSLGARFWATYWPSHVVVTEHSAGKDASLRDQQVTSNLQGLVRGKPVNLQYIGKRGIIDTVLEQRDRP